MLFSTLFLALFASTFSSPEPIGIDLEIVNVLERLGLAGENDTRGAAFDGRLDAILALGSKVYTAKLWVGTPPQPVHFLLNWVGDLISPGVGDFSFVLSPNALAQNENASALALFDMEDNGTRTFNSSASKTFKSRPDVTFQTTIQPNPLNFSVRGFFGEDVIMFKDRYSLGETNITARERLFGQVERMQESKLFDQLSVGGMLSMSKQGALMAKMRAEYSQKKIMLFYGKKEAQFVIDFGQQLTDKNKFCQSAYNYYDLPKDFGNETGPGLDAYRLIIKGVNMKGPDMEYDDKIEKSVLINPNSMFIEGPRRTVAKLALMVNAEKRSIGRHQLYTINCNEQFGPLSFKMYTYLSLGKENLTIELPGNLLPAGQCLWAIQELQENNFGEEANAPWIFGRPFFQEKYCLVIDPLQNRIAFPNYVGEV